ncbi:unnamed protein product [Mytilus coruscus]|uniref:Uncharacterized protein n=1 Tax=Mytilus coruscus TaxID=42192 RepID=A0A6J8A3F9_MYTCO|nr:unnamed protein product [Mytilus coruscus]
MLHDPTFYPTFYEKGMQLDDVDVTIDYAGSFNKKNELVDDMLTNHGFSIEGSTFNKEGDDKEGTILENTNSVGNNCLTYMTTYKGHSVRSKDYNKFVQSLESASIRGTFGTLIWDGCNNPGSRLRKTIPCGLEHGLTRIEATFYGRMPTIDDVHYILFKWSVEYLTPKLCYSTQVELQWKALAEQINSTSLFYCEATREVLAAHWVNEYTGKVGGVYKKVDKKEELEQTLLWVASELTFAKPVHILHKFRQGTRCVFLWYTFLP